MKKSNQKEPLVGLTYDLKQDYLDKGYDPEVVAEFDSLDTIEGIEEALQFNHYRVQRIGSIKELTRFLNSGQTVDLVFNIAEGLNGICREAQIPCVLDAYSLAYVFSSSIVLAVALHKGFTKAILLKQGLLTPDYEMINTPADIEKLRRFVGPLFLKPVSGGTGIGIDSSSLCKDFSAAQETALKLLKKYQQPVIAEIYLPGREFTVGIVGTGDDAKCIGTMEIKVKEESDKGIYSYKTKMEYEDYASYSIPEGAVARECEDVALASYRALGCRDGGRIDLKMDDCGRVNFIEANPLAGLNPKNSDLPILCRLKGISYHQLIGWIMDSAMKRLNR
ncbi:MAG: D-alanine--D-alanine ligase [Lentisphaeria bacterium]